MNAANTRQEPSELEGLQPGDEVLNRGGWANGDVYLTAIDGGRAVLKTYAEKPRVIRWLGRYLLGRERRAYRRLAGIPGIPALVDAAGNAECLALEYVPGERISNRILKSHGPEIVSRLTALIEAMHARGVYHLDLRNQGNVLISEDLKPTVLDFASSIMVNGRNPVTALIASLCRRVDLYGLSKWRDRSSALSGEPAEAPVES